MNIYGGQTGFEPWRRSPAYTLSRRAPSTTRPPVRWPWSMRLALGFQEPKIDFRAYDSKNPIRGSCVRAPPFFDIGWRPG